MLCRFNRGRGFWRIFRRWKDRCFGDSESQEFAGGRKTRSEIPASPENRRFLALQFTVMCYVPLSLSLSIFCWVHHKHDSVGGGRTWELSNTTTILFARANAIMHVNLLFGERNSVYNSNNFISLNDVFYFLQYLLWIMLRNCVRNRLMHVNSCASNDSKHHCTWGCVLDVIIAFSKRNWFIIQNWTNREPTKWKIWWGRGLTCAAAEEAYGTVWV